MSAVETSDRPVSIRAQREEREQVHYWARDYPHAGGKAWLAYFDLEDGRIVTVHMGSATAGKLMAGLLREGIEVQPE